LYDDHNAGIVGGDVDAETYWEARAAAEMLDAALDTEQPWNAIANWLPDALRVIDAALAVYPNHARLAECRVRAAGIDAEADPDYGTDWARGFPWAQASYRKGWVALHWARFARTATPPGWQRVRTQARRARSAWETCHDVHDWPDDVRSDHARGVAEAEQLADEAFRHLH
jgi:hypothetical protein